MSVDALFGCSCFFLLFLPCWVVTVQLWAWGRGEHGRLGLGEDKASKMTPVQVLPLADETIVQVRVRTHVYCSMLFYTTSQYTIP